MKNDATQRAIQRELAKRLQKDARPRFSLDAFCFDKQLAFVRDTSRFKVALCSRRAGKSIGIAADLINTCNTENNVICAYITLTHANARNIIWGEIVRICDDYQLNVKLDSTRLYVYFNDTRSELRLGGAKDENEIEKYRGWKLRKVYIDEVASFRPYIRTLVEKILIPALRDHRGMLGMTGTPGPVPTGFFHDQCHNKNFSQHRWTAFDNPHMHSSTNNLWDTLREEWLLKGVNETDASVRREDFGEWHEDLQSLVFQFDRVKNVYDTLPDDLLYVLGIDIGWNDSDAIAVMGYSMKENKTYLVNEDIANKQDITALVEKIKNFQEQYKPVKMVMDAGALGKKIQEEINARHGLFIHAAEKHRKFEYIKLLNDDLRTGRLQAKEGTRFEQDCFLAQWDKTEGHRLAISKAYHSDVCFIAGTKIQTSLGPKNIEDVVVGDLVLTREGFKPLNWATKTKDNAEVVRLVFSNGVEVTCTPNHPIYTKNRNFVRADELNERDEILTLWEQINEHMLLEKQSCLTAANFTDTRTHRENIYKTTTMGTTTKRKPCYIGQYGSIIKAPFQKASLFIIKTEIPSTTTYRILSVLVQSNTLVSTSTESLPKLTGKIWHELDLSQLPGTVLRKVKNGMLSTPNHGSLKIGKRSTEFAQFAAVNSKEMSSPQLMLQSQSAQINVTLKIEGTPEWMMSSEIVSGVRTPSQRASTVNSHSVVGLVTRETLMQNATVYNLSVAGPEEYFANGILVHNCDSVLYSWRECKHYIENAQQQAIPKETDVRYGKYLMEQTLKQYHESQEDKLLIPDLEGFDD